MATDRLIDVDVAIFGGGAAGLWLLDDLLRAGYRALLLEAEMLGAGQTAAAQGILHGGLKHALGAAAGASPLVLRDMPPVWRDCIAGRRAPDLARTRVHAASYHMWCAGERAPNLGAIGEREGLRSAPEALAPADRPRALAACPGAVHRVGDPVIDPVSLLDDLASRHGASLWRIDAERGLALVPGGGRDGDVRAILLAEPGGRGGPPLELRAETLVLTAGAGNAALRARAGLSPAAMQRRPLHMVMARGPLPLLNGHCVDESGARLTITSAIDEAGRRVWQVGGRLAEEGVLLEERALCGRAREEVSAALPGLALDGIEWAAYRVDRAEGAEPGGRRSGHVWCRREGNVITAWPTKLTLVPRLVERIRALLPAPARAGARRAPDLAGFSRPRTAPPPWETARWSRDL